MVKEARILIMQLEPYFMSNPEWYYFDEKEWMYKLTEKAPEKARESYKEFYEEEARYGTGG